MPAINFLIKPASSNCNLRCTYCFYHSIAENRTTYSYGLMKEEVLETIVRKGLAFADGAACGFAFQGGEPTLVGLDFFRSLVRFQEKYNVSHSKITNALQTNGMVIDDEWSGFLHEHHFLVGLSLDGPAEINNAHRFDARRDGSFSQVMKTVRLFDKHKVAYNILSVVTANAARHAEQIYRFIRKNHFDYWQFIFCLDPDDQPRGSQKYSLKPGDLEVFLKKTFDLWYLDMKAGRSLSIRYFDNILGMLLGMRPESCSMQGVCQNQFVIEANGDVFPCDFYVTDQWRLGSIVTEEVESIQRNILAASFIQGSVLADEDCKGCQWFGLCRGGCRRDRDDMVHGHMEHNYYCEAFRHFYEYSYTRFLELAHSVHS